jgi:hypothetical protein
MLSALALSLWIASLFCDLLYLGGAEAAIWAPLALYTLVGGFVAALAAATPQLRKVRGLAHIPLEVLVLALYALNLSLRLGDSPNTALAIALSMFGVSFLALSSWLGGRAKVRVEGLRSLLLASGLALSIGLAGWTEPAGAQLFSSTGPVIAILDGELLVGEATGHLGGWGTIALRSRSKAERICTGEFSHSDGLGDSGRLRCSDGARAAFRFQRLTMTQGHGAGSPGGSTLSFTYGLSTEDSMPYLELPPGKALRGEGDKLELVAAGPFLRP